MDALHCEKGCTKGTAGCQSSGFGCHQRWDCDSLEMQCMRSQNEEGTSRTDYRNRRNDEQFGPPRPWLAPHKNGAPWRGRWLGVNTSVRDNHSAAPPYCKTRVPDWWESDSLPANSDGDGLPPARVCAGPPEPYASGGPVLPWDPS